MRVGTEVSAAPEGPRHLIQVQQKTPVRAGTKSGLEAVPTEKGC